MTWRTTVIRDAKKIPLSIATPTVLELRAKFTAPNVTV
jgi:hypothetical protein